MSILETKNINPLTAKVLLGDMIHTIVDDQLGIWDAGRKITFFKREGSPETVNKICTGYQIIKIQPKIKSVFIITEFTVDRLSMKAVERLSKGSGYDSVDDFWNDYKVPFNGKIVHWTYFRY